MYKYIAFPKSITIIPTLPWRVRDEKGQIYDPEDLYGTDFYYRGNNVFSVIGRNCPIAEGTETAHNFYDESGKRVFGADVSTSAIIERVSVFPWNYHLWQALRDRVKKDPTLLPIRLEFGVLKSLEEVTLQWLCMKIKGVDDKYTFNKVGRMLFRSSYDCIDLGVWGRFTVSKCEVQDDVANFLSPGSHGARFDDFYANELRKSYKENDRLSSEISVALPGDYVVSLNLIRRRWYDALIDYDPTNPYFWYARALGTGDVLVSLKFARRAAELSSNIGYTFHNDIFSNLAPLRDNASSNLNYLLRHLVRRVDYLESQYEVGDSNLKLALELSYCDLIRFVEKFRYAAVFFPNGEKKKIVELGFRYLEVNCTGYSNTFNVFGKILNFLVNPFLEVRREGVVALKPEEKRQLQFLSDWFSGKYFGNDSRQSLIQENGDFVFEDVKKAYVFYCFVRDEDCVKPEILAKIFQFISDYVHTAAISLEELSVDFVEFVLYFFQQIQADKRTIREFVKRVLDEPKDKLFSPLELKDEPFLEATYMALGKQLAITYERNQSFTLSDVLRPYFGNLRQVTPHFLSFFYDESIASVLTKGDGLWKDFLLSDWGDYLSHYPNDPSAYILLARQLGKGEKVTLPYQPYLSNRLEVCLKATALRGQVVPVLKEVRHYMLAGESVRIYHPYLGQFTQMFRRIPYVSTFMSPMSPVIGQLSQMMTDVYGWMMGRSEVFAQLPNGEWVDAEDVGEMISRKGVEQELALAQIREGVDQFPMEALWLEAGQMRGFDGGGEDMGV